MNKIAAITFLYLILAAITGTLAIYFESYGMLGERIVMVVITLGLLIKAVKNAIVLNRKTNKHLGY